MGQTLHGPLTISNMTTQTKRTRIKLLLSNLQEKTHSISMENHWYKAGEFIRESGGLINMGL